MTPCPDEGRRRRRRTRRTGVAAITALVTSAAVALLGWAGPTYATTGTAAAPPNAGAVSAPADHAHAPAATQQRPGRAASGSTGATARKPSASPAAQPSSGKPSTAKSPAAKPSTAKPSTAQLKALRAKAAARALASASPRNSQDTACGGPLAFDTVHACDAIPNGGSDSYTLTTSVADDLLTIQLAATSSGNLGGVLTGPDGTAITCILYPAQPSSCATGPAGAYTLVVSDQFAPGSYTLAVSSLRSSPCTQLAPDDLDFGSTPLTGALAAGAASSCYALGDGAGSGDLLRLSGLSYAVQGIVYDANNTVVCGIRDAQATCSLTGTAPYRMLLRDTYAQAASYAVSMNRLSHPGGCPALAAAPFGDPGSAAASGTLPIGGADCRTVTLPGGATMISLKGGDSTSGSTTWALYTAQGDRTCGGTDDATCTTPAGAATYTLLLQNVSQWDSAAYTIALVPLTSTDGCAASVGTSYALPLLHRTLGSAVQADCQAFDAQAGDRIDLAASTDVYGNLVTTIVDPSGTPSCSRDTGDGSSQDGCVLTGTGPYRVITHSLYDFTGAYTMRIARLSDPAGCTDLSPQAYGTAPAGSTDPCWLLHVPAAGTYDVGGTGVYHLDGTRFCTQSASSCTFPAAGTYAMVFRPGYLDDTVFAPVFVSPAQTAGCVAASDQGFVSGAVSLDLTAAGVRDCLMLPTASGNGLYLVPTSSADGRVPVETVYDAKGVQQCENEYAFAVCKLTGTAPFHLVVTAPVTGTYGLAVQRTGDAAGCAAWPRTPFGASTGTPVTLTAASQTACLALPASGHSTAELFDFTNTANRLDASVRVFDAAGNQVCASLGSSATTCQFTAGVGYTAVLVGTGTADTYHLVRRDVSSSASCAAPASLTLGGPSTGYTFTSALDSRCLRVQAATTDKLWLSVRTPAAAAKTGADLLVVDAGGAIVCWQHGVACRVSGSASYVVAVLASGYTDTPIAAYVDTWRVGTAAGWVPQCTANSLSPDGFAPRSGTLTETSATFCGVMQVKPMLGFTVYGATTSATIPTVDMYSSANWDGTSLDYAYQCSGSGSGFAYWCSVSGAATQVVVILSPGSAALPVPYTVQGVCRLQCSTSPKAADVTSVSPSSGPAGGDNQVVIHGSNLTLGTDVKLEQNGLRTSDYPQSAAVSVSADGTTLTVLLSTRSLTPGRYDVVLDDEGYTVGTRSTGYLPGGYTVTAGPLPKWGGPLHVSEPAWMAAFLRGHKA